jgi:streptogramin lyase
MKTLQKLLTVALVMMYVPTQAQIMVSTIAGTGNSGYCCDGDSAVHAQVATPSDIAVDVYGNVYIADQANNRIRVIDTNGIIRTLAGNGTAGYAGDSTNVANALLNNPTGVALDKTGRVYIADNGNNVVRMIDTNSVIYTIAGTGVQGNTGDGGNAKQATFYGPERLYIDDTGSIYICDIGNNRVRKVDTFGIVHAFAGNGNYGNGGDGGQAVSAELKQPTGIARDKWGNFYITDYNGARIRKVNAAGIISTFAGNGNFTYSGDGGMADTAALNGPSGIVVDTAGNIYFGDYINNRLRVINTNGIINTYAGTGVSAYNGEGLAPLAANLSAYGVAMNVKGDVYFTDLVNSRVRKIAPPPPVNAVGKAQSETANMMLYPNPTRGEVWLVTNAVKDATVQVYDMSGRIVYTCAIKDGKAILHLHVSDGVYIVSINDGTKVSYRQRLVVAH